LVDDAGFADKVPGPPDKGWREWRGTIRTFNFKPGDVVFIGDGNCAKAALTDAVAADAIPVIMQPKDKAPAWVFTALNDDGALFDAGTVPGNRKILEVLQRHVNGADAYLAGEIPRRTAFRAAAMVVFQFAFFGEHPRRMQRRAFEESLTGYGFNPASLHAIHVGNPPVPAPPDSERYGDFHDRWQQMRSALGPTMEESLRPRYDSIREATETALITETFGTSVHGISWLVGAFDTAFFDADLASAYRNAKKRRLVLDQRALLFGSDALIDHCASIGLDLCVSKPGVEQDCRTGGQHVDGPPGA
jgi:hypothetical protein